MSSSTTVGRPGRLAAALLTLCAGTAHADILALELQETLDQAAPSDTISTLVYLSNQLDTKTLSSLADDANATLAVRHEMIVRGLQSVAQSSQQDLLDHLQFGQRSGEVAQFQAFWVSNVVRVDASPQFIEDLAERLDVGQIYPNYEIELDAPVSFGDGDDGGAGAGPRAVEPGVLAIRADEVWAMGITGAGVLVSNIDTGVDGNHPALASRWRGVADPRYAGHPDWAWFDPYTGNNSFPFDSNGHGTHTMGTVTGGAPGDQVGVAPGAQWIAAGAIDRGGGIPQTVSDAILSFQWLIDPDGDPGTNWDVPAVCSNSWRVTTSHGYPPCDETFWSYLDNCQDAGIAIIFSAGNEGPSSGTVGRPPDRATTEYRTMAVAAIDPYDSNWPVASFSSRGPSYCTPDGSVAIKPDIAAPGVNTRSSVPGGGYSQYSGTSMASPHVNGVVALMREANPNLAPEEMMQIIYDTAVDLGTPGEDNSYGYGMIDAYECVIAALSMSSLRIDFPNGRPDLIDPTGGTTVQLTVSGQQTQPEPGSGKFYWNDGGGWVQGSMIEIEPDLYEATFPSFDCGALVDYYFSVDTTDGETVFSPFSAPDNTYSGEAFSGVAVAFEETFDANPGWDTEGQWAYGQPTGGGGAYGGPDPTSGYTGPNVYGYNLNGDYTDNMPEYDLTSTAIDCSDLSRTTLKFWRWLGVEQPIYDHAYIRLSTNGSTWTTVWENSGEVADTGWVEHEVNIAAWADGQPTVYLRWTIGTTDSGWTYCGWNIDDVRIESLVCDDAGCPGDFNGDGQRDQADLGHLLGAYGVNGDGDMDGDGDTDQADLGALLGVYGVPCP
jgi:bacillopeptidase F